MRTEEIKKLCKRVNILCNSLDDLYNVNFGGCCFLAYLIAKHLDKLDIPYKLVIFDYSDKDIKSIKEEVCNCSKNNDIRSSVTGKFSCNHYCLRITNIGTINESNFDSNQYVIDNISYKNILWLYKKGSWNSRYNIEYNKTIKNLVKEFFKEYE